MTNIFAHIKASQFKPVHILIICVLEMTLGGGLLFGYIFFSFLVFGEGVNSFMYTTTNTVILCIVLYAIPTIINVARLTKHVKLRDFSKAKSYLLTQALYTILYAIFIFQSGMIY